MAGTKIASYGSWHSPITSDIIVSETVQFSDIALDGRDVFWVETRPSEGGRNVLVRCTPGGQKTDITPADFNVRKRAAWLSNSPKHQTGTGRGILLLLPDIRF